ncbi:DUF1642 domain-containing protein [Lactococcus cremoris]
MTKFEEEVNKYNIFERTVYLEGGPKKILIDHFKNWHSDEEFQQLLEQNAEFTRENNIVNQINSKLAKENEDLKSQFQQQALPVVPECVAEWIEILKTKGLKPLKNPETYEETGFTEETLQDIVFWISEHQEDYMRAWLDGYTVEKPQLFYLKHIDMSKSDAHLNWYLAKGTDNVLIHQGIKKGKSPKLKCILKLTQQEIDSMQTGSYEKIEVHMEDGE